MNKRGLRGNLVNEDEKSIKLIKEFIEVSKKQDNELLANCLEQLIYTIKEIGIENLQPQKPIETEVFKSIEDTKFYYLSTVKMSGEKEWYETALFLCDQEGVVECWNPVMVSGSDTVHEAHEERRKIRMMAESGKFDRINPWMS